ncbi:MAG: hypothetical protein ACSLEN_14315 [Candidatus Malihini olakiniferum]
MTQKNKRLHLDLSDHGQDFLYFIVDGGKIIEVGRFQNGIWSGKQVLNTEFNVGDKVEMVIQGKSRFINYPIESITVLEALDHE